VTNCIVWYNLASSGNNLYDSDAVYTCSPDVSHGNEGCITNDPLFIDQAGGDYRLAPNSPCINAGENAYAVGEFDLDGNPRIVAGIVDMGAYEHAAPALVTITTESVDVVGEVDVLDVGGTATEWIVGFLTWTNAANGENGTLPASTNWLVTDLLLAFGKNMITVSGTNREGVAASDSVTITRSLLPGGDSPVHYVATNGAAVCLALHQLGRCRHQYSGCCRYCFEQRHRVGR